MCEFTPDVVHVQSIAPDVWLREPRYSWSPEVPVAKSAVMLPLFTAGLCPVPSSESMSVVQSPESNPAAVREVVVPLPADPSATVPNVLVWSTPSYTSQAIPPKKVVVAVATTFAVVAVGFFKYQISTRLNDAPAMSSSFVNVSDVLNTTPVIAFDADSSATRTTSSRFEPAFTVTDAVAVVPEPFATTGPDWRVTAI
jgi:hypothetical protein